MRKTWCEWFHREYWILKELHFTQSGNAWIWFECDKCFIKRAMRFFNTRVDRVALRRVNEDLGEL